MNAKIFGWSEKRFWLQWYRMYKLHFKDGIDEKVVRIQGPMAPVFRPLTKENIISVVDPDVKIESLVISEAKRIREQQSYDQYAAIVIQDPETDRRFIYKKMAKLRGHTKEEIDAQFPPTPDEEQAKRENDLLNEDELPTIDPRDDHRVHIRTHAKANQTSAARAHVKMHQELQIQVRNHPELFPVAQSQGFQPPSGLGPKANLPVENVPSQPMQAVR
jgi:hypothetical protein